MRHKTLFLVLLKVLGLYLLVNGLTPIAFAMARFVSRVLASGIDTVRPQEMWNYTWAIVIQGFVNLALALYFFFGGRKVADLAFPNNNTYCGVCGWDLTRITESHCPECGADRHTNEQPVET